MVQISEKLQSGYNEIMEEVIAGLNKKPKQLPCKFFYDKRGSELFEKICTLPEYYLTRTELEIMSANIDDIISFIGNNTLLVELGSGSSLKTRLLLDNLPLIAAYVPLDISYSHLMESVAMLSGDYPDLKIFPICTDYTKPFKFPDLNTTWSRIVVFYPGSTIGNFIPEYAKKFLDSIANRIGKGSGLLIGVDLKKNISTLEKAYNDSSGITAQFNLNILSHLNSEISANFKLDNWYHKAVYNKNEGRIEMHLVSASNQSARLNGTTITFSKGESIITEYSYKYHPSEFRDLAKEHFRVEKVWTDEGKRFSLQFLTVI